mmetsp:Transcript_49777/g.118596  ORF Transcript_49777/g.118596 Transcript_49777/m.118596 type:complete len:269 (+) Transcript_49777:600-1406(+)
MTFRKRFICPPHLSQAPQSDQSDQTQSCASQASAHETARHPSVSDRSVWQGRPPWEFSDCTVLDRTRCPRPQLTEHGPQGCHSFITQSTESSPRPQALMRQSPLQQAFPAKSKPSPLPEVKVTRARLVSLNKIAAACISCRGLTLIGSLGAEVPGICEVITTPSSPCTVSCVSRARKGSSQSLTSSLEPSERSNNFSISIFALTSSVVPDFIRMNSTSTEVPRSVATLPTLPCSPVLSGSMDCMALVATTRSTLDSSPGSFVTSPYFS